MRNRILPLFIICSGFTAGQVAPSCSNTNAIDQYVSALARNGLELPWRRFEQRLEPDSPWREVAKWTEETVESAVVFSATGAPPFSLTMTLTSYSGDWSHSIDFYYRPDGTLAKRHDDLRTFHGEITAIRDVWFDCGGKKVKSTRRFYLLGTKKPRIPDGNFTDEPVPLFKRVEDLPFYSLLQGAPMGKRK